MITNSTGKKIDFYKMEYNDKKVYDMIGNGDTQGVFQLESGGMTSFMRSLRPSNLEDIIAGIALYRPGPMDKIPDYVAGKKNPNAIKYAHPKLKEILQMTYGVIVYQEQVMQIVRELGGYTLGRADIVRRLMSKKKPEEMKREKEIFLNGTKDGLIKGALKNGIDQAVADNVFEDMTSFANYAFNKSHAAAYAYLSYQTAYLKYHYPQEFFASMLNNRITKIDEVAHYLGYIKEKGMKVLPPSINASFSDFVVERDAKTKQKYIRMGMSAIKNVGVGFIENLVLERESKGKFKDFKDFIVRLIATKALNKKNLEAMILTGCFDEFRENRPQLLASFEQLMVIANRENQEVDSGQFNFFDAMPHLTKQEFVYPELEDYPMLDKLKYEKEAAGIYLSGHPLEQYTEILKTYPLNTASFFSQNSIDRQVELKDGDSVILAGVLTQATRKFTRASKEMGMGKLEDMHGSIEVMVGYSSYEKIKDQWVNDNVVSIKGKVSEREGTFSIWIYEMQNLTQYSKSSQTQGIEQSQKVYLDFDFNSNLNQTIDQIKDILAYYDNGKYTVFLQDTKSGDTLELASNILYNDMLKLELCGVLGSV
jgi:DNA polymerase-3 subunit alpha